MPITKENSLFTDEELLSAFRKSHNNKWLGLLLQRYTSLLFGVALKYLKDTALAEDAVQQVFLKVLTHLPVEEINNFKGWLYVLMRNHCLQQLRDKKHYAGAIAVDELSVPYPANEDLNLHEYTLQQLEAGLETLQKDQRLAITLFYLRKLSYEQIMAQTGFTFMQVKSFIQNGKRNLRTILLKKLEVGKDER